MTHAEAAQILRQAWLVVWGRAPTSRELLYTQAIASLETGYGRAGQFGALAAQGKYNWGALERRRSADGTCPAGTEAGSDQGAVCFYVFPNDVSAAAAFVKLLTKSHWPTVSAMNSGSPEDVATAMRVPPAYYAGTASTEAGKISAYANAIRSHINAIGAPVPGSTAGSPVVVLLAGVGLLGWGLWEISKISPRRYAYRS